ncbi:metal-sensitive transcriptional regulator [Fusobacterium sp. PH5-44]|uniref:metal-sensitive transcriptional regulator n=1 Tax=unclassified Fusobacterium TaxID=2648384 RepID=UPI003D1B6A1F
MAKEILKVENTEFKKNLSTRLNRIEGQLRGIKKMVENDIHCDDVLNQISSVKAALNGVSKMVLESHIKHCLVEDIKSGQEDKVLEGFLYTLNKILK